MKFRPLKLIGSYEIVLEPHKDDRGYFMRTYDKEIFQHHGLDRAWLQENQSMSYRMGTVRGLHFQEPPFAETKLVRAVSGAVLDVIVDLRIDSPSYGQWESVELSGDKLNMVYVPKGFAHGFCTLTQDAVVGYKVDACYAPHAEGGVLWNDVTLNIPWPVNDPYMSTKDQALPALQEFESPFRMGDQVDVMKKEK